MKAHLQNIRDYQKFLESNLNKDDLHRRLKGVIIPFVKKHFAALLAVNVPIPWSFTKNSSKVPRKDELVEIAIAPFYNERAFALFQKEVSSDFISLMDGLIWTRQNFHQETIEKDFELIVYNEKIESGWNNIIYKSYSIKPEFDFFTVITSNYYYYRQSRTGFVIGLPVFLKKVLSFFYEKPAAAYLTGVEEIEEKTYRYITGETDILLELPRIIAYHQQGNIKFSAKGKPAVSTLNKMQRILNLNPFYPKTEHKNLALLRTRLIAGIMGVTTTLKNSPPSHDIIKLYVSDYYLKRYETSQCLFNHLGGTGYLDDYSTYEVEPTFIQILEYLPIGKWVSINNVEGYISYNFLASEVVEKDTAESKLYYGIKHETYTEKEYIDGELYHDAITKPLINGTLFLFGALGLLDLSYDTPDLSIVGETAFSDYDELKHIRLTTLGAYVVGRNKDYSPADITSNSKIELSEDSLTITTDKNNNTAVVILNPYAERITPNRYRTDYNFFLKDCSNKKELENKINLFKQTVCSNPPKNWLDFFTELNNKINPLKKIANITTFQIPSENSALIKIIAKDSKLKSLCIKAEGYIILVEKSKMPAFKKRLREFGYLI